MKRIAQLPCDLMIGLIKFYRLLISPMFAPTCRFWPSCSLYALDALQSHGAARGGWLAVKRLCRCHPWSIGGLDPVPPVGLSARREQPCHCGSARDPLDSFSP